MLTNRVRVCQNSLYLPCRLNCLFVFIRHHVSTSKTKFMVGSFKLRRYNENRSQNVSTSASCQKDKIDTQCNSAKSHMYKANTPVFSEWRITHALSHHLHTNTINDLEISALEPFLEYLPGPKHNLLRFGQVLISPGVWLFISLGSYIRSLTSIVLKEKAYNLFIFLPFSVLVFIMIVLGEIFFPLVMFMFIQLVASLHFGAIGLNGGHHHPDLFHDGDTPRPRHELDWGIHQLDSVMDRRDITGSHFWVLTNFGSHALHHMFPTIDHGRLEYLYPIFLKTCAQFGIDWKHSSHIELIKGQMRQLIKIVPTGEPPTPLKHIKLS